MSRFDQLGERKAADLAAGRINYRERGAGRPIVFIHGLLVNGDLWRNVVPAVADAGFRCITPDLPLGSHETAMARDADLTPPGLAAIIASFLDELGLDDVVLVGNDTGGALTQLVITSHPKRVGGVVLTNCDCFERFFPPLFRYLQVLPRIPGALAMLSKTAGLKVVQKLPTSYGALTKNGIPDDAMASYVGQIKVPAIRRDTAKVLRGIDKRYTIEAADQLGSFDRPTLLAWGTEDRSFRIADAERLVACFPRGRLERIEGSSTFVPEDAPDRLVALITEFAR
jgi:pimeloyl-ACP methyl ester carboxylesterase